MSPLLQIEVKLLKQLIYLSLFATFAARGATVSCQGNGGDVSALQSAIGGGGNVTIIGTCFTGTAQININNAVTFSNGGAAAVAASQSATNFTFVVNSDNVSFDGIAFSNAGIYVTGSHDTRRNGVNITNCTFQHFNASTGSSPMNAVIKVDPIWQNSSFTGNTITDAWYGGFANTNSANARTYWSYGSTDSYAVHAILINGGLDNTKIEYNKFDKISGTGVKLFADGLSSKASGYTAAGVSISYNELSLIHRSGFEIQNMDSPSNCTGGCNGFAIAFSNPKFAGNYFHTPAWIYHGLFGFTIPIMSTGAQYINNLASLDISGNPTGVIEDSAYAFELPPGTTCCGTGVFQGDATIMGNLITGDPNPNFSNQSWRSGFAAYGAAKPQYFQNMIMCGANQVALSANSFVGQNNPNIIPQYNFTPVGCPGGGGAGLYSSDIEATWISSNQLAVTGNLPIRYVNFFVDGALVATQEVQDVNVNFAADARWLYHVDLGSAVPGTHTITARITDVSGTTKDLSQTSSVGGNATPAPPTQTPTQPTQPAQLVTGAGIAGTHSILDPSGNSIDARSPKWGGNNKSILPYSKWEG
jgi:hypothetical protein